MGDKTEEFSLMECCRSLGLLVSQSRRRGPLCSKLKSSENCMDLCWWSEDCSFCMPRSAWIPTSLYYLLGLLALDECSSRLLVSLVVQHDGWIRKNRDSRVSHLGCKRSDDNQLVNHSMSWKSSIHSYPVKSYLQVDHAEILLCPLIKHLSRLHFRLCILVRI